MTFISGSHGKYPFLDTFCMTFESPFVLAPNDDRLRPASFDGYYEKDRQSDPTASKLKENESTEECKIGEDSDVFIMADELLTQSPSAHENVPNLYQKIIDILLRFKVRGIEVFPEDMLKRIQPDQPSEEGGEANSYQGYMLDKSKCFLSPDEDEIYIKLSPTEKVIKAFAESRGIFLPTNPYAFAGGKSWMYSAKVEEELIKSVRISVKRKRVIVPVEERGWGFSFNTPTRQRLISRYIREPWRYGGCGIQVNEMMMSGVLVNHFFPLHDDNAPKKFKEWASWKQSILSPMQQDITKVIGYFGEEVALYFFWIKKYNQVLALPAVLGLISGFAGLIHPQHKATINGAYAIVCVGWGAFWNMYWLRLESIFAAKHQLQDIGEQATLRERYTGEETTVDDEKLFSLQFNDPPVFKADGTLVEISYAWWKRFLWRYGVSYPLILMLSIMMVGLLCLNTYFRLEYEDSSIQYGCSIISVVISTFFDYAFSFTAHHTSILENNRTDEEEDFQKVIKKFFHYFFSSYFSLISLLFWPNEESTDEMRLKAMELQMITNCIVMPFIQNVTETIKPIMMARWRINRDYNKDDFRLAVYNTLTLKDQSYYIEKEKAEEKDKRPMSEECRKLWQESQKEPLPSLGSDYLEIAIQYGYMTMFAVSFPWAAAIAFVFNVAEIRVDANKILNYHQRPLAKPVKSIGAWKMIFAILSGVAVITNSFVISVMSDALVDTGLEITTKSRYQFFVGFQYMLVVVAALVYIFTPITPSVLSKASVKQSILLTRHVRGEPESANNKPDSTPNETINEREDQSNSEQNNLEEPLLNTCAVNTGNTNEADIEL